MTKYYKNRIPYSKDSEEFDIWKSQDGMVFILVTTWVETNLDDTILTEDQGFTEISYDDFVVECI